MSNLVNSKHSCDEAHTVTLQLISPKVRRDMVDNEDLCSIIIQGVH